MARNTQYVPGVIEKCRPARCEKLLRARIKASGKGDRFVDPNKERRITIDNLLDALKLYHERPISGTSGW